MKGNNKRGRKWEEEEKERGVERKRKEVWRNRKGRQMS